MVRLRLPGHHLDLLPVAQEGPPDVVHAVLGGVIMVIEVLHHLLGVAPIDRRERLVVDAEDVRMWVRRGVLEVQIMLR